MAGKNEIKRKSKENFSQRINQVSYKSAKHIDKKKINNFLDPCSLESWPSLAVMTSVETAKLSMTGSSTTDERRAKAMEEHRRLVKEHCEKESKLRDRIHFSL